VAGILLAQQEGFFQKGEESYLIASIESGILEKERDIERGFSKCFLCAACLNSPH
jgi:hypothetical protein